MPGVDLGPVTIGAVALAALTYVVYRSVQRARRTHRAGQPLPGALTFLIGAYVVAWIGYVLVIVGALAGRI